MKYYTIYETVNKETGKSYRGFHKTDNLNDGYLGSGKYLKRAVKKHGAKNFNKLVLYIFDNKEDMVKKEAELVNDEYLRTKNTYNLKKGGDGGWDYINDGSEKHIERCKNAGHSGSIITNEKAKNDFELKKKMLKGFEFWHQSDNPEIKKRRIEISRNNFKGKCHTKETKNHMSQSQKKIDRFGDKNPNFNTCWIYNDKESIRINKNDLNLYLQKGWIKGRKIKFAL